MCDTWGHVIKYLENTNLLFRTGDEIGMSVVGFLEDGCDSNS